MTFLEQYTRGHPRDLVKSCQHLPPRVGYQRRGKLLLFEHFGNGYKIATAYMDKFLIGLRLQQSMQQRFKRFHCFSDVAAISRNRQALQSQKHSYEASYKLRERWRSVACDLQEQSGNRARFTDLVTFVKKQVKTVSDPLFGNIQEIFRGTTQIKCMIIYYNLRMSVVFLFFRLLDFLFPCRTQRETSADNQDLSGLRLWVINSNGMQRM